MESNKLIFFRSSNGNSLASLLFTSIERGLGGCNPWEEKSG